MAPLIEAIHVMCGVTFFGLMVASFLYISSSMKQNNSALLRYAIKTSLIIDGIIFPIIVIQFVTGTFMVRYYQLSFQTPWIIVAYGALSAVSIIWFFLVLIKYRNLKQTQFQHKKLFYFLNFILILLFCMIIHDAVMQQTWLWR